MVWMLNLQISLWKAFYDYLANDWSVSSGELPWASSGFSFADLLPESSIEARGLGQSWVVDCLCRSRCQAQAIQVLEDKVPLVG